jgi:site-specific DNA-methyltransferase (adenine-specific)
LKYKARLSIATMPNQLIHDDCLEAMKDIPDGSVDMVLADLPYGVVHCDWDCVLPLDKLWTAYTRIIKENGAIILTAIQPFTTDLINSNRAWFKYEWIWLKNLPSGHLNARKQPLRKHENVLVFYDSLPTYNPQYEEYDESSIRSFGNGTTVKRGRVTQKQSSAYSNVGAKDEPYNIDRGRHPGSTLFFKCVRNRDKAHTSQKPTSLFEYLIRTYTNEGETVLDNTAGVMTTAIACLNTSRQYICIEKDDKYFELGSKRVEDHIAKMKETAVQGVLV